MNKRQRKKHQKKMQELVNGIIDFHKEEFYKIAMDQIIFGVGKMEYRDGKIVHVPYNPFEND